MVVNSDSCILDGGDGDILMDGVASNESSDEGVQKITPGHHLLNGQLPKPDEGDEAPVGTTETNRTRPQYTLKYTLSGHTRSISSIKFSPDGTMLASSGALPLVTCLLTLRTLEESCGQAC